MCLPLSYLFLVGIAEVENVVEEIVWARTVWVGVVALGMEMASAFAVAGRGVGS